MNIRAFWFRERKLSFLPLVVEHGFGIVPASTRGQFIGEKAFLDQRPLRCDADPRGNDRAALLAKSMRIQQYGRMCLNLSRLKSVGWLGA